MFVDFERTIPVALLAALYALVVIIVASWRGVRAIGGLILSFVALFGVMIPALLEGGPPFWVGLVGSSLIMLVVLYFAHGSSLRTTTVLLGTFIGLLLTAALAAWASDTAYLIGLGEEYSYMLASVVPEIRLSGIVLTGLLIAGLGVLNDVTIMSAEMVDEVVRILVGSVGLVLAIPITTGIAVAVATAVAEPAGQQQKPLPTRHY